MSLNPVNSIGRASLPATAPRSDPAVAASTGAEPSQPAAVDEQTQQPVAPRFPWLSRLSQQLETASGKRASFPAAPVLGDHVDRSA